MTTELTDAVQQVNPQDDLDAAVIREYLATRDPAEDRRRTARRRGRASAFTTFAFAAVLIVVEVVIAAESWSGLAGFGLMIHLGQRAAWGVPVTLDGVGLLCALIALLAELKGEASGLARLVMFAFTIGSAAANCWHGWRTGGVGGALYLGGMSLAVAIVFALILRQLRLEDLRHGRRLTDPLPKFGLSHWLRYPGLTFRALSLAIRDGHATPREAIEAAKASREAATAAKDVAGLPELPIETATLTAMPARDRLAVAFGTIGRIDVPAALALLKHQGAPVDQSHAYQVRRSMLDGGQQ